MFWGDNFLIYLIGASSGTLLKAFSFFPVIEEHDKVHNSLIMEALGKYKETVYSLKLPHPKNRLKYSAEPNSNVPRLKKLERLR